jgi:mannose-6-phosphate isomerase-like protein (cupin superfamily)
MSVKNRFSACSLAQEAAMEIVSKENAEHYIWGQICDGWHLLKSSKLSVIEERVPPGGSEIMHYHQRAHQFFYILSGKAAMEIDGRIITIEAHQGLSVPPKVPHRLFNESQQDLFFITISAPMSHGDRYVL